MPHRFRKMNEVVTRVQRARSAAIAFRLAGESRTTAARDLYWPDLIHVLEAILPSSDELGEALADIHADDAPPAAGAGA